MRKDQTYRIRTLAGYWKVLMISLFCILGVIALCCVLTPTCAWWEAIGFMLLISSVWFFFGWGVTLPRYQIKANMVQCSVLGIRYREIKFSEFPVIIVTNATFHVKTSGLFAGEMPMIDKEKTSALNCPVSLPYFIAVTEHYPSENVRSGMNAATVYSMNWYHAVPIGLCYPSALENLRNHTNVNILVQPDVLKHYPEYFSEHRNITQVTQGGNTENTVCK